MPGVLLSGLSVEQPPAIQLRAGTLSMLLENGSLRYIRGGDQEAVRSIYFALRDRNWNTIPGTFSRMKTQVESDSFAITYVSTHREQGIDFEWNAEIRGRRDGSVTFSMEGIAGGTFQRNRIGFCILHPMSLAGVPCVITHPDGTSTHGQFPVAISPHQPFFDIVKIAHPLGDRMRAEITFEGEVFEMEDQRNWTDASYKTYCTPLGLPFPAEVQAGTVLRQKIILQVAGEPSSVAPSAPARRSRTVDVELSKRNGEEFALPLVGACSASDRLEHTPREAQLLRLLRFHHVRTDLRFAEENTGERLSAAAAEARLLGTGIELALHLSDAPERDLGRLAEAIAVHKPPITSWIVFKVGEKSTAGNWVSLARTALASISPSAPIGAGTDAFFAELNRNRPPLKDLGFLSFSINPQVHAFDNASLVETLGAQAVMLRSARAFAGDRKLIVSPVTFRMRFNPNATSAEPPVPPGTLPPQVDTRQLSLFGAAWTLGSLTALCAGGAASMTFFETAGWLGVLERENGSPLPRLFPSVPGGVYPLFHVLADFAEFSGGTCLPLDSTDPLAAGGCILRGRGTSCLLIANYTGSPQMIAFPAAAGKLSARILDEKTRENAVNDPEGFREMFAVAVDPEGIQLSPYAMARIMVRQ